MPEKIFYSFVTRDGYKGNAPRYFDKNEYSWSKELEENWEEIKKELNEFLSAGHKLWPYFDQNIVTKKNSWKTIPFYAWGVKFYGNSKKAPKTISLLEKIPGMVSASFNLLEGNTAIVPHYGDTNAVMRCHLGLVIPGELPEVGFEVDGEKRAWKEGELLFFCDAHNHTAWNNSENDRYILLFDVIRPEYLNRKKVVCSNVLASLFLQSTAQKISFAEKVPMLIQFAMYKMAIASAYVVVPVRNFFTRIIKG